VYFSALNNMQNEKHIAAYIFIITQLKIVQPKFTLGTTA
jgi:hypothetical protein